MNNSRNLLVLGVTGQVGKLVAKNLRRNEANFSVGTRRKGNLKELADGFGASRFIDLDDPRTFDEALKNVTSIFLITAYTVDMLAQSKSLIDAAKRNGVNHIVHLGAFTRDHDAYATVFAWHQMIEAYLRDSGVAWTNLHPNMFMQSFLSVWSIKGGLYSAYTSKAVGFTALEDVAEAAAVILMEGPEKHTGKDYWFSADVLTPDQVAETLSAATGRKFTAAVRKAEGFQNDAMQPGSAFEPAYAKGGFELFDQVEDGRMAYIGSVADDTKTLLGREPLLLRDWAKLHANELLEAAGRESGAAAKAGIASTLASFVKANNDRDIDSVTACFSRGAVVHDDGQILRGTDEIRQWITELFRQFQYVVAPTNVRELENGAILTATITGNFPGGRVSMDYHCRTSGDKIDVMIIQPSRGKGESMNIGVIGPGDIGEVIVRKLRDVGYPVKMANSRGPESLKDLAAKTGAIPTSVEQVVQDVDMLFLVVPQKAIPQLPKGLLNKSRKETIVIDVGNYYPFRDGRISELENGLTESVWVERQIGRPVVKVFNTIIAKALAEGGRPAGSKDRVALPISGDSPRAKETVAQLLDRIGFDSVDAGTIAESWRQQPGSPVYCTNPTKEELQFWLQKADRSSLATGREKVLEAYLAVADADYQTQVKAHRSVLINE